MRGIDPRNVSDETRRIVTIPTNKVSKTLMTSPIILVIPLNEY